MDWLVNSQWLTKYKSTFFSKHKNCNYVFPFPHSMFAIFFIFLKFSVKVLNTFSKFIFTRVPQLWLEVFCVLEWFEADVASHLYLHLDFFWLNAVFIFSQKTELNTEFSIQYFICPIYIFCVLYLLYHPPGCQLWRLWKNPSSLIFKQFIFKQTCFSVLQKNKHKTAVYEPCKPSNYVCNN